MGDKVRISPPVWPNHKLNIQPGDLTKFVPYGNGVYGYQGRFSENPIKSAPSQEPSGGVIYFGNGITKADFKALLRLLEVQVGYKDYAVFVAESEQPGKDGYLVQMRIVTKFGLKFMFGALTDTEYDKFPEQQLTIGDALREFIEREAGRWGTSFMDDGRGLQGLFGGDGDYAREELAFGFMMENEYHGVYRIWSRAWLVTK
ncbi:MAG: hypothetical protein Q8N81_05285 [bacterium]|nr:hypothetical protein [bacterium]